MSVSHICFSLATMAMFFEGESSEGDLDGGGRRRESAICHCAGVFFVCFFAYFFVGLFLATVQV